MRFSALFSESQSPLRSAQGDEGAGGLAAPPRELPEVDRDDDTEGDDLAERVRRIGEWQLEDW